MNQVNKRLEELRVEAQNCVARDATGISCLEKFPNNPDEWCSTCAYYIKRSQHLVN